MIGYLSGKIISAKPTKVLLDVNGVGYQVNISINTFEKISDKPEVSLFIYTSVKEDSITLFGFFTETEKEMFELLISVNGIGPKLGLSILSGIQTGDLRNAINTGDISRIVSIPGIGTMRKGTQKTLGGTPPYKMVLGNASGVTLLVDGKPFALAPYTKDNIARFSFRP